MYGEAIVHWWDNRVTSILLEFYPNSVTCLPRRDAIYRESMYPFEYKYVGFNFLILARPDDNLAFLGELGEPTGIVVAEGRWVMKVDDDE